MPYTFGAGTGDDISWSPGLQTGNTLVGIYVAGWWCPTTLTATRGLWSFGNTLGAEIDSTTDELRFRSDNTTDGQWTTTGVDLAVNGWKFIACFATFNNTGPAGAWRAWAGDIQNAPIAVTVTQAVAPVGNFAGSSTFYIGNKGTGALAFQGDAAHVDVIIHDAPAGTTTVFPIAAAGAITAAEEQYLLERFVWNSWLGRYPWLQPGHSLQDRQGTAGTGAAFWHFNLDLGGVSSGYAPNAATAANGSAIAINGATPSLRDDPRGQLNAPQYYWKRR